jgi:hypothetical protein
MNARSTPFRILRYHAIDQVPDLFRDPFSANLLSHLRDQAPVHTESGTVPARYGLRSNHHERALPCGPKAASEHPEEFVEKAEPGFGALVSIAAGAPDFLGAARAGSESSGKASPATAGGSGT